MTNPLKNVKLTGYTGVQAGAVRNASNETYANAGAILGGEVNYKGTFLKGQVEAGTALGSKLELGHTFDIGRNMGLEISANAQRSMGLASSKGQKGNDIPYSISTGVSINTESGELHEINYNEQGSVKAGGSWRKSDSRYGLQAKLTFGSEKARFGAGIEAGMHSDNRPTVSYESINNTTIDVIIGDKKISDNYSQNVQGVVVSQKTKGFVTPTLSADINLGKGFSLNAKADFYQGSAGIRYNF